MNNYNEEKSIINIKKNSILQKIKLFFLNIFKRKTSVSNVSQIETNPIDKNNERIIENTFKDTLKNIENEETQLLKLQKQYDNREISEDQLTEKQIIDLIGLYKKQISGLAKNNELLNQKLMRYNNNNS